MKVADVIRGEVPFVHLRVRSAYSLAEGALPVPMLARLAREHEMPALGVADTNNLFGALEISQALAQAGIQPITGCTLTVAWQPLAGAQSTAGNGAGGSASRNGGAAGMGGRLQEAFLHPVALFAMSEQGYANLMQLASRAWLEGAREGMPHVRQQDLAALSEGLICLTGGPQGPLDSALAEGQEELARAWLDFLHDAYGDRLYMELQRHGLERERRVEPQLVALAYEHGIPLVATNDCHFPRKEDYEAHDALLCIADGEVLANPDRRRLTPEHYFKSAAEMRALFADLPEAMEMTAEVALRCHFRPTPRKPILPHYSSGGEEVADEAEELKRQAREGLRKRLEKSGPWEGFTEKDYEERLAYELDVIIQMGFPGYFLIVSDFIKWAKAQGIPVGPGRGSGAGSLVAWALTITDLDPLRFGLLFERFLNPERVSMPDFDIDFCQDRREEVIRYVQGKYGHDSVAQIITFGKLQARAVCRDVGRVLGMPYPVVDRLSKMIPPDPKMTLEKALAEEPRIAQLAEEEPQVQQLLDIARKLEGLYRHASTHAAGVVIGDRPLTELVPLYFDPRSELPVTQFNMAWVEQAGLVKFDFLGLKTLTVIERACDFIRRQQPDFDINRIPLDDQRAYELMARGETVGVFQLESEGMRDALRRMEPDCIEDIIAVVALYRPGPMENIPKYCAIKKGEEKPDYMHPKLEPILKETHGIIVYQEQVMQIAQVLSGYSLGEADLLRRAMGKKKPEEMARQKERFVGGAVERGIDKAQAEMIFDLVARFASYGFNKSHAACYALIAYQTAWLKANHPVAFLAASMTLDMGNTDKLHMFRREAQRLGIAIEPPDVNRTQVPFEVAEDERTGEKRIIYSLAALKNVGVGVVEHIVQVREKGGPFTSLADFARRVDPHIVNRRALESLARAGAFDAFEPNRRRVLEGIDAILQMAQRAQEERASGQASLFGGGDDNAPGVVEEELPLPEVPPWPGMQKLEEEFAAVGFYLSGHPLDDYMQALSRIGVMPWAEFQALVERRGSGSARLAGAVTARRDRRTKKGSPFAFVEFSDPTGQFEAVCFSELLASARELLEPGQKVIIGVEATLEEAGVRLRMSSVEGLEAKAAQIGQGLMIHLQAAQVKPALKQLQGLLQNGGRSPVRLVLHEEGLGRVDMLLGEQFTVTPQLKAALEALPGIIEVREL